MLMYQAESSPRACIPGIQQARRALAGAEDGENGAQAGEPVYAGHVLATGGPMPGAQHLIHHMLERQGIVAQRWLRDRVPDMPATGMAASASAKSEDEAMIVEGGATCRTGVQ